MECIVEVDETILLNDKNIIDIDKNIIDIYKNIVDNLICKKKKLIEISKDLSKIEYLEIFSIIQNDNCAYSENKNGVFINLSSISESTIDKIFDFINFIKHKKEDLIKYEEYVNIAKKNIVENKNNIEIVKNIKVIDNNDLKDNYTEYYDEDYEETIPNSSNYLLFSSDEDEDLENKISLKKKKIKYSGKKAKMIKSIRDSNDTNKLKNRSKKIDEKEIT